MRALYALLGFAFFLTMIGLMVWAVIDDIPFWMFIPALLCGVLGLMFTGASRGEFHERRH